MSFLSTLDASKLMQAARANLQPLVDNSEDKALAELHAQSIAWQQTIATIAAQLADTAKVLFDGYEITAEFIDNKLKFSISKKQETQPNA